jgi:two-component system, chemotaxis family, sensor kinase CheA
MNMDDLLQEFLTETNEAMDVLDTELIKLEQNPNDPELLGNIFRLVHTIKGTCGFLGLPRLESVAHAGENVLGKIRDGELEVTPEAVSLVLESLDQIKDLLSVLESTEQEPDGDDADLIRRLNAFVAAGNAPAAAEEAPGEAAQAEPNSEEDAAAAAAMEEDGAESAVDALQAAFDAAEYKGPGSAHWEAEQAAAGNEGNSDAEESDTGATDVAVTPDVPVPVPAAPPPHPWQKQLKLPLQRRISQRNRWPVKPSASMWMSWKI